MARDWDETIVQPRSGGEAPLFRHSRPPRRVFPNGWRDAMYAAATWFLVCASLPFLAAAGHAWGWRL